MQDTQGQRMWAHAIQSVERSLLTLCVSSRRLFHCSTCELFFTPMAPPKDRVCTFPFARFNWIAWWRAALATDRIIIRISFLKSCSYHTVTVQLQEARGAGAPTPSRPPKQTTTKQQLLLCIKRRRRRHSSVVI